MLREQLLINPAVLLSDTLVGVLEAAFTGIVGTLYVRTLATLRIYCASVQVQVLSPAPNLERQVNDMNIRNRKIENIYHSHCISM